MKLFETRVQKTKRLNFMTHRWSMIPEIFVIKVSNIFGEKHTNENWGKGGRRWIELNTQKKKIVYINQPLVVVIFSLILTSSSFLNEPF